MDTTFSGSTKFIADGNDLLLEKVVKYRCSNPKQASDLAELFEKGVTTARRNERKRCRDLCLAKMTFEKKHECRQVAMNCASLIDNLAD